MPLSYERAKEVFKKLGVKDADRHATEESSGDEPSLVRFLLLKGLWSNVIADDPTWMDEWADRRAPVPAAIKRMLGNGIDPADLTMVVRDLQIDLLFNVCCLLDDAETGIEDLQKQIPDPVGWQLVEHDGTALRRPVGELHGDFYDFDPTGRRGEPLVPAKKRTRRART